MSLKITKNDLEKIIKAANNNATQKELEIMIKKEFTKEKNEKKRNRKGYKKGKKV